MHTSFDSFDLALDNLQFILVFLFAVYLNAIVRRFALFCNPPPRQWILFPPTK